MTDTKILYDIKNLVHRYDEDKNTLFIESLEIKEGSVMGLIGPNGSGKSTLLKVLAFLEPYAGGIMTFGGVSSLGRERALRRSVTYMLQDSYLLRRSVYENVAYGLSLRGGYGGEELKNVVFDSLKRVGLPPENFAHRPWYRLSGGEAQRVALASRLALRPKVLLLDEPTANVDESSAELVKEAAVSAWREWGTTVVVATHDLAWLHEVSTETVSLYHGRVAGRGTENFIQGDWKEEGEFAVLTLPDGQTIRGRRGALSGVAAGMLNPSEIKISRSGENSESGDNVVKGLVVQMVLERSGGSVLVYADTGGPVLKARLDTALAESGFIRPAQMVTLSFSPCDVRLLEKN